MSAISILELLERTGLSASELADRLDQATNEHCIGELYPPTQIEAMRDALRAQALAESVWTPANTSTLH